MSGLVALIMLSAAAGWGLSEVMAPGWAFLLVGAVWTVAGGVLGERPAQDAGDRSRAEADDARDPGGQQVAEDPGTDQLRNQIDEQRAAISDTVEQIENRVVPGRVMARGQDRVRGRMAGLKPSGWLDNLSNPLAAGALREARAPHRGGGRSGPGEGSGGHGRLMA